MKRLLITFLLTLLLASSLAAQTRVTLSSERVVTGPFYRPTLVLQGRDWKAPAFAAAGRDGHYLMAWSEYDDTTLIRSSMHVAAIDATGSIVPGTRYVAAPLRTTDPHAQYPAVAFDGERFLVAWIDGRFQSRLVAMRFDRDGRPLEAVPQQISLDAGLTYVAAAAGGGEFTIAYSRLDSSRTAAVARIAADGTLLERDRTVPGPAGFWRDIESNGTAAFLVSDSSPATLFCAILFCETAYRTFARIGAPSAPITTPSSTGFFYILPVGAGVATDGERFLAVTWLQNTTPTQSGSLIRGQLTDLSGERFVREFLIAKHPQGSIEAKPGGRIDTVWTGSSYAIAYELVAGGTVDLHLTFASQTGMALIDPVVVVSGRTPIILPLGESRVLVLYERGNYSRPEIVARQATLSLRTRAVR